MLDGTLLVKKFNGSRSDSIIGNYRDVFLIDQSAVEGQIDMT